MATAETSDVRQVRVVHVFRQYHEVIDRQRGRALAPDFSCPEVADRVLPLYRNLLAEQPWSRATILAPVREFHTCGSAK